MALDQDGRRIECQHLAQKVVRIEADGSETLLADAWQGVTLNSPNDVVVGPDGSLYFGDARIGAFAHLGGVASMPLGFQGLYRIDPAGALQLLATGFSDPTGIELSPDAATLYVSDWTTGRVHAFPRLEDGSVGPGAVINTEMPMADGMCSDADGNLYVTTHQGLWVLRPDGTPWGLVPVPEEPSNCTFGGDDLRTLYVTARTSVSPRRPRARTAAPPPCYARRKRCTANQAFSSIHTSSGRQPASAASSWKPSMVYLCEYSVRITSPAPSSIRRPPTRTVCARRLTRCISIRPRSWS
jgi:sugar lactone lactonase YvrE